MSRSPTPKESRSPQTLLSTQRSSTNRALAVAEILYHIFKNNDRRTNVICARVNRAWHNVALDFIWHTVSNLSVLFQTIAPLTVVKDSQRYLSSHRREELVFAREILLDDWTRFYNHTRRVKALKLNFCKLTEIYLNGNRGDSKRCDRIFIDIALKSPFRHYFPSLRSLECGMDEYPLWIHCAQLFLGEQLSSLKMLISGEISTTRCIDLKTVGQKAPNVESLELTYHHPTEDDVGAATLLAQLKELKHLTLSSCVLITPRTLLAAASLPSLESLIIGKESRIGCGREVERIPLPDWPPDVVAFPNLARMKLHNSYPAMVAFFQSELLPKDLVELEISGAMDKGVRTVEPTLSGLFECVVNRCGGSLQKFVYFDEDNYSLEVEPTALRPLSTLAMLTQLSIDVKYKPIDFTDDSLPEFLTGLPHLQHLELPHSIYLQSEKTKLTPNVLASVARLCPQLVHLALFFKAVRFRERCDLSESDDHDEASANKPRGFAVLQTLNIGASPILKDDVGTVANYLSKLLPPTCTLDLKVLKDEADIEAARYSRGNDTISDRYMRWVEVEGLLKLFITARMEGRP